MQYEIEILFWTQIRIRMSAKSGYPDVIGMLASPRRQVTEFLPKMRSREVANVIWCLGRLGHRDEALMSSLLRQVGVGKEVWGNPTRQVCGTLGLVHRMVLQSISTYLNNVHTFRCIGRLT